ncbi:MAG: pyruvate kinase [Alphaproteobacteria bacterium]|nr:pyruvate kinase [Alphaproteobacteria bacterium]
MTRERRAKIIATLGPASSDGDTIADLYDAGADVFRLNFSHGSHDDHAARVADIRALEKEVGHPIGILMDLQGPKLRVGTFANEEGVVLKSNATFQLDMDDAPGDENRVGMPHPEIFQALKPGASLLINDGHLRFEVLDCGEDWAETKVIVPGTLTNRKGVNVPDVTLPLPAMTDKDKTDLDFGLGLGVDWVALSFVQSPADVVELKSRVKGRATVIAKLEKPAALKHLDEIVKEADGVMIARGDLGVEVPLEQVPVLQKRIIRACRAAGKPSIVATQMLETMIKSPMPTRAEASDVATAVYDGADAVMLSAETAAGDYPVRAVATMDRIVSEVEGDEHYLNLMAAAHENHGDSAPDAITAAARQVATDLKAKAIVTYTTSGSTTLRAARERPPARILCLTPSETVARRFALVWGVHSVVNLAHTPDERIGAVAIETATSEGLAEDGDLLVVTAGVPFGTVGSTNMIRVVRMGEQA